MLNQSGLIPVFFIRRESIDRASISTTARPHWLSTLATATVYTSTGDKLLASAIVSISAVPAPAFRCTAGAATNTKAESTQTIVYCGSRSGSDRCCFHRFYVRPWFAAVIDSQSDYKDNTPRKPTHVGFYLSTFLTGDTTTNDKGYSCRRDNRQ